MVCVDFVAGDDGRGRHQETGVDGEPIMETYSRNFEEINLLFLVDLFLSISWSQFLLVRSIAIVDSFLFVRSENLLWRWGGKQIKTDSLNQTRK